MGHHGLFLTTDYNVWFLELNMPLLRLQRSEGKFTTSRKIEPVRRSFCRRRSCLRAYIPKGFLFRRNVFSDTGMVCGNWFPWRLFCGVGCSLSVASLTDTVSPSQAAPAWRTSSARSRMNVLRKCLYIHICIYIYIYIQCLYECVCRRIQLIWYGCTLYTGAWECTRCVGGFWGGVFCFPRTHVFARTHLCRVLPYMGTYRYVAICKASNMCKSICYSSG